MLTHALRQPPVSLIFDVRQKEMAYFPLHQVKLPPKNLRRAQVPALFIFPFLAVFGVGLILRHDTTTVVGLTGALLSSFTTLLLLVPVIVLAVAFMLIPAATFIVADFHDYSVTKHWWFWALCLSSTVAAIITLKIAGKLYPRRNEN